MNADKVITISNVLTCIRILLTPVIITALLMEYYLVAFGIVVLAAATDLFDGWLARILNEQTHFGAVLDPVADKIFIIGSLAVFVFKQTPIFRLPLWFFYLLIIRESIVMLGSVYVRYCYPAVPVQPTLLGKVSAAGQMLFIIWLFISYFFVRDLYYVNEICIATLTILTVLSCMQYFYQGLQYLCAKK